MYLKFITAKALIKKYLRSDFGTLIHMQLLNRLQEKKLG